MAVSYGGHFFLELFPAIHFNLFSSLRCIKRISVAIRARVCWFNGGLFKSGRRAQIL